MGIPLVDHIIVGGGTGEYFSYRSELKEMFNIDGMQTLLKAKGIDGIFAEPGVAYNSEKEDVPDFGPKRVQEEKAEEGNEIGIDDKAEIRTAPMKQEYKPLAKVEELEEENYNQIDNNLSNIKPKAEEIREKRQEDADKIRPTQKKNRPSLLARMQEKTTIVDARKQKHRVPIKESQAERMV